MTQENILSLTLLTTTLLILTLTLDLTSGAAMNKAGATKVASGLINRGSAGQNRQNQKRRNMKGGQDFQSGYNGLGSSEDSDEEGEVKDHRKELEEFLSKDRPPSPYAQDLFDLLGLADTDDNGEIIREEYSRWNMGLKFPENDAQFQFDSMDRNKNGLVTLGEYYVWVRKFWTSSKSYIEQTFRDADDDLSGSVTRQEYLKWHKSFENTSQSDTNLEFLDYDKNGDGLITISDFEMAAFMKAADQNMDGFLTLQEYLGRTLRYLPSTLTFSRQKTKDELDFVEMDTNGDGFLSLRELEDDMY